MKKTSIIITIFLILSIFITSCGKEIDEKMPILSIDLNQIEVAKNIDINALYWVEPEIEQLQNTADYINDEFGIELNISIIRDYDLTGGKTAKLIRDTENGGIFFFYFSNIEKLEQLAKSGEILSLNEFLTNNETWNALPSEMKDIYSIGDENVWALSRSFSQNVYGRVFKKEALDQIAAEVPTNLNELYEVSKKLSNIKDAIGMVYYNPLSFNDIFYSNDTPISLSHTGYNITSIVYDSKSNSYEDSMLKLNMHDSLNYIRKLIDEDIAIMVGSGRRRGQASTSILNSNNAYVNAYGAIPTTFFANSEYEIIYGINGSEIKNINPLSYNYNNGYYVLGANTPNANEVINSFLSVFYGDIKGYISTSFGPPLNNYEFNGDTLIINNLDFFKRNDFPIINSNPLFNFDNIDIIATGEVAEKLEQYNLENLSKEQYIQNGLSSEKMINLSITQANPLVFPNLDTYALSNPAALLLESVYENLFRGFISVEEGVNQYTQKMKELGQQEIIDQLNEKIGSNTQYKY